MKLNVTVEMEIEVGEGYTWESVRQEIENSLMGVSMTGDIIDIQPISQTNTFQSLEIKSMTIKT